MDKQLASKVLTIAAVYNVVWGGLIILFPHALFDFAGLPRMNYPGVWQCVGMIVGVYGIGYWVAASDPDRHWPIVLVGLLGKIFGPIGFLQALYLGVFNLKFGLTIISNDIIWWIPFYLILKNSAGEIKTFFKLKFVK
ncbi:MAG: alkyl hydroperoxide reductase [Rhizobacter sp.]|nr:alkyl hydroperoxide reductase [Bacteriovorax sp.]